MNTRLYRVLRHLELDMYLVQHLSRQHGLPYWEPIAVLRGSDIVMVNGAPKTVAEATNEEILHAVLGQEQETVGVPHGDALPQE